MKSLKLIILGAAILTTAMSANASLISFQVNSDIKPGTTYTGIAGLTVTGGVADSNVLTGSGFSMNQITSANIILDGGIAGLGVCSEGNQDCSGSTDSLSSNTNPNNPGGDEILFFNFDNLTSINTVWLNGDHKDKVDGDLVGDMKDVQNALFNIFYSNDNDTYTSIWGSQQQPTDLDYFAIDQGFYKYWAVAATGWGDHSSYVSAMSVDVPEPATLGLLALGLAGIGAARRKQAAK